VMIGLLLVFRTEDVVDLGDGIRVCQRSKEHVPGDIGPLFESLGCLPAVRAVGIGEFDHLLGPVADLHGFFKRQVLDLFHRLRLELRLQVALLLTGQVLTGRSIHVTDKKQILLRIEIKHVLTGNDLVKPLYLALRDAVSLELRECLGKSSFGRHSQRSCITTGLKHAKYEKCNSSNKQFFHIISFLIPKNYISSRKGAKAAEKFKQL